MTPNHQIMSVIFFSALAVSMEALGVSNWQSGIVLWQGLSECKTATRHKADWNLVQTNGLQTSLRRMKSQRGVFVLRV